MIQRLLILVLKACDPSRGSRYWRHGLNRIRLSPPPSLERKQNNVRELKDQSSKIVRQGRTIVAVKKSDQPINWLGGDGGDPCQPCTLLPVYVHVSWPRSGVGSSCIRKGVFDTDSGDGLFCVQILRQDSVGAALESRGNNESIPESDPGFVLY